MSTDVRGAVHGAGVPSTFQEFPPRMKPASFTIDQVMEKMEESLRIN